MMGQSADQALTRYSIVASELASLFQERGSLLSATIEAKLSAYEQAILDGSNVTNARHAADLSVKHFDQETAKMSSRIQALEVELRYLDQLLTYERSVRETSNGSSTS